MQTVLSPLLSFPQLCNCSLPSSTSTARDQTQQPCRTYERYQAIAGKAVFNSVHFSSVATSFVLCHPRACLFVVVRWISTEIVVIKVYRFPVEIEVCWWHVPPDVRCHEAQPEGLGQGSSRNWFSRRCFFIGRPLLQSRGGRASPFLASSIVLAGCAQSWGRAAVSLPPSLSSSDFNDGPNWGRNRAGKTPPNGALLSRATLRSCPFPKIYTG